MGKLRTNSWNVQSVVRSRDTLESLWQAARSPESGTDPVNEDVVAAAGSRALSCGVEPLDYSGGALYPASGGTR